MYFAISENSLIFEQQSIINLVGQKRYLYQNNYPETKRLPFYIATP